MGFITKFQFGPIHYTLNPFHERKIASYILQRILGKLEVGRYFPRPTNFSRTQEQNFSSLHESGDRSSSFPSTGTLMNWFPEWLQLFDSALQSCL
jgi:hypothetical protein